MDTIEQFADTSLTPPVRGFLHRPESPSGDGIVLTHGAGGNAQMPLLVVFAEAFADAGYTVLRCDLPFRQARRFGPPRPSEAARDREGLNNAIAAMRKLVSGRIFLGGQSYGGRQASMLVAEHNQVTATAASLRGQDKLADGLLLLSYPLHPPGKPDRLRTEHLPQIRVPVLFVHGTKDPFGSIEEIESAKKLIPARTDLLAVEGAGHDLGFKGKARLGTLPAAVLAKFSVLFCSK